MKKIINKILLSVLVLCELFNTTTVYALTKDETVYAKLKENGEIDSVSISEHLYNYKDLPHPYIPLLNIYHYFL